MSIPAPLVIADTETTGIHKGRLTWEVGMIRRDEAGRREISFFVEVDLSAADPFGLAVGRFYERHPLGQKLSGRAHSYSRERSGVKTRVEAAHIVAQSTHGAHVVGAIPSFDTDTDLDRMLREAGLTPAWHHHIIDVEALAVGYLHGRASVLREQGAADPRLPLSPPWRSDDLNALLGLPPVPEDERHTALGDCRWAERIYDKVMGQ